MPRCGVKKKGKTYRHADRTLKWKKNAFPHTKITDNKREQAHWGWTGGGFLLLTDTSPSGTAGGDSCDLHSVFNPGRTMQACFTKRYPFAIRKEKSRRCTFSRYSYPSLKGDIIWLPEDLCPEGFMTYKLNSTMTLWPERLCHCKVKSHSLMKSRLGHLKDGFVGIAHHH